MATQDRDVSNIAWDREYIERMTQASPHRFYRTNAANPFLTMDNTADMQAAVDQAYARITDDANTRLRFRNPNMAYTDSGDYHATINPTSRTGTVVMPLDHSTLNDMQSRLNCIESILTRSPGYESAVSIALNANDHSQELQSLLREFNTKAAERGLLDISDPDNRALAELCRSVLRKADASARRTQYAKEAAAHKVTSPELDGARISYLNTRLEALNTNLASVDTKIQTEQTKVAELEKFINQLKEAFERHSDHQKRVMEAFTSAYILPAERLAKLEEFYTKYDSFLLSLQGHIIPTIEARLAAVEAKLNSDSGKRSGWDWFESTPKWTCRT